MSCYFRHIADVFDAAGIEVTKDNKKEIDRAIHQLVAVEYKDCQATWKAVKEQLGGDEEARLAFVSRLKRVAAP